MNRVGRITTLAVILVVGLRLAIGWQLFYEGIWKVKTLKTPTPWTAAGYLKNAQGPMRDTFRSMAGDPNELGWLNSENVAAKWDNWHVRFVDHYRLSDNQKRALNNALNGPKEFYSDKGKLAAVPEGVDLSQIKARVRKGNGNEVVTVVRFDSENQRLAVDGRAHLQPSEKKKLLSMAGIADGSVPEELIPYKDAVEKVYARAARLSYKEKLRATLDGDPENAGVKSQQKIGEIETYREMLRKYETALASVQQDFQRDHLNKTWGDIQEQRAKLTGPIKSLESDLKSDADQLLTIEQHQIGELGDPWSPLRISDLMTILGLTCLGLLLIVGLFTRFAAVMAALMLFMFYMAMPPLPGLPEAPGPEHSLIVNKNLIEVVALLAIATLPTGYWFGLDKLVYKIFRGRKANASANATAAAK